MHYAGLSEAEKHDGHSELSSDICTIMDRDFFIRVCLEIPIHDFPEPFLWGVWVSISRQNLKRYLDTWDEADESDAYFGWFSNRLPYYPDTINLKAISHPRRAGQRPYLELEPSSHPLALDFHNGISAQKAIEIAQEVMHPKSDQQ